MDHHAIVRRDQHARVKVHVVSYIVAAFFNGFFHAKVSGRQGLNIGFCSADSRQSNGRRFNHLAQGLQVS